MSTVLGIELKTEIERYEGADYTGKGILTIKSMRIRNKPAHTMKSSGEIVLISTKDNIFKSGIKISPL
jgi:hypothetical protein